MTKVLVLDDEPLLHMALMLVLEKVRHEVEHLNRTDDLLDALGPDVACVVLDLGMANLDRAQIIDAMNARAPQSRLVLIGPESEPRPSIQHLWTAAPHADAKAIAAFVDRVD